MKLTSIFNETKEVEAVIGIGATMLVLPQEIVEELTQSLSGQIILEQLDVIVDTITRKAIPDKRSPEMPMVETLSATACNSRYVVRYHTPKPLRVPHTHKTLCEMLCLRKTKRTSEKTLKN